jgi:hypothetical protein
VIHPVGVFSLTEPDWTGRVPQVRLGVPGPKKTGEATRVFTILTASSKRGEEKQSKNFIFGPGTLRRTWGTRPTPTVFGHSTGTASGGTQFKSGAQRQIYCFFLLGPRVCPVVNLRDLPDSKLGIALCGRQPLVSQQLLNSPQVSALLQHVRAESMA